MTQGTNIDIPDSAPVITGSSTTNTVTINADAKQTANVTLSGVNIDVSGTGSYPTACAAVSTSGEGSVTIELNGTNTVRSGFDRAGLEKNNTGSLTITDANNDGGSLDATGGEYGAGIGGGSWGSGSNITLSGGTTKAAGGLAGAGLGGGERGNGSNITVSGDAQVKVQGGNKVGAYGTGAPIGDGGKLNSIDGAEVTPDVSELTAEGQIEYYAPGVDMSTAKPIEGNTNIGKHEHEWDDGIVTKEPTCTETGVMTYTCQAGNGFKKTEDIPLLKHEFKDYVSDNNATYTQDGTKTAKCV